MTITILKSQMNWLRLMGVWPSNGADELNPTWFYYFKFTFVQSLSLILPIGSLLHLIVSIKHDQSFSLFEDIAALLAYIGCYSFLICFVYHQKDNAKIFIELSNIEKYGKPPNYEQQQQRLNLYTFIFIRYVDISGILYGLYPFYSARYCHEYNKKATYKEICGLLFPTWMPFNVDDIFLMKQILHLLQIGSLYICMKTAGVVACGISETIEQLIIRIGHLKVMINEICLYDNAGSGEERRHHLRKIISYHNYILELGQNIDKSYTDCLFIPIFLTGALFGLLTFCVQAGGNFSVLILFCAWLNAIIMLYLPGQRLIDESLSIGECAYFNCWPNENSIEFEKDFVLIIKRCQTPLVVHCGPFSYMSRPNLLLIAKTAYSYLALMNATSNRN